MDPRLEALETELIDRHMAFHPGAAVAAGIHRHDLELEDFRPQAIEAFAADLERLRARALVLGDLAGDGGPERDALLARIEGTLHEYRELAPWRRDPYFYMEALSGQLNTIAIFDYAPLEERLRAVAAKERLVPSFLAAARANLEPTAPILVKFGVEGAEGALTLVRDELPAVFAGVASPALRRELEESTRLAGAGLDSFLAWLREGYPPGEARAYAHGRERFAGWLGAAERCSTPLEELEAWALGAIDETREALAREARRIDPAAGPVEVVARITSDHPSTGQVVAEARRIAEEVYAWLEKSGLVTLPAPDRVRIADTPGFMRWSFGSMWTPGPFETARVAATFYATDADPSWPPARQEEHLTAFSYRGLENLAIHEAYPGHFVQALHQNRVASPLRKSFWWGVFGEGWAHYCEQLAVDEGFGGGAPEPRIVQCQEALNRLCRFVNGIRLHTRPDWDLERGTRFFEERAWLAPAVARAECERGSFDAFYLRYTLGKKAILDLREECRTKQGPRFDLRAFHDALLGCGSAPMTVMRALTLARLGIVP